MALKRGLLRVVYKISGDKLRYLPALLNNKKINVYEFINYDELNGLVTIDYQDRSKFFAICKNMCYNISVVKYKGILSPAILMLSRWGLVVGSALFIVIALLLNNLILKVEVVGSGSCFANQTISVANKNGANVFSTFSSLDFDKIETEILTENPRLSFVSIEKQGNKLVINTVLSSNEPSVLEKTETDLVSLYDGVIEEITVLRGMPIVAINQTVKKGDLLVGAYLIKKDGEVYSTYVVARVKIIENYKYFYKCDYVNDIAISTAFALAEFNASGDISEKSYEIKDGGIEVTLKINRIIYGGN